MSVIPVTQKNYQETIVQSEKPVMIDLWASWCGPCKMLSPIVEQLAEDHPEWKVCKINVDDEPQLAQQFRVSAIPTLVFLKNGEITATSVGFRSKAEIENML
ncbi:MAG: thioredoxin [Oscillospiraceae bacterium]|nr:thioredoxin [Oscillospiraceae bacterium]